MANLETKTVIRHGIGGGEVVEIPPGERFPGKYSAEFSDEEVEALELAGSIGPRAKVDEELADINAQLAAQLADVRAQLAAALGQANLNAEPGTGADVMKAAQEQAENERNAQEQADKKAAEDAEAKAEAAAEEAAKNKQFSDNGPKL